MARAVRLVMSTKSLSGCLNNPAMHSSCQSENSIQDRRVHPKLPSLLHWMTQDHINFQWPASLRILLHTAPNPPKIPQMDTVVIQTSRKHGVKSHRYGLRGPHPSSLPHSGW